MKKTIKKLFFRLAPLLLLLLMILLADVISPLDAFSVGVGSILLFVYTKTRRYCYKKFKLLSLKECSNSCKSCKCGR